jgi:phage tail-like protein
MTTIPPYRQFLLLAPQPGWRAVTSGLLPDTTGALTLDPLPGNARTLPLPNGPSVHSPRALARMADGALLVLDASGRRLRLVPSNGNLPVRTLPGIGGAGPGARHFRRPVDIAVLSRDMIAVADAGAGAVKLFSPFPHALLAVWTGIGTPVCIEPGPNGLLWVADRTGKRVLALDGDGAAILVIDGLTAPTALAADTDGRLAILDSGNVVLITDHTGSRTTFATTADASCIALGPDGLIYVGTTTGLLHVYAVNTAGTWQRTGSGVFGQAAALRDLVWDGAGALLAIARSADAVDDSLWTIDIAAGHIRRGTLDTTDLDSGIADCVWHRIELDADLPAGTGIDVWTETHSLGGPVLPDLVAPPLTLSGDTRDCLVQGGAGQVLRLHLVLRGDGAATPVLRAVRIWFPRASWVGLLPAVYQEDDVSRVFLERFLSIVQTDFDAFDETIDTISTYFDPRAVPSNWFKWLAAWLALPIEPTWTDAQRRSVLAAAYGNYRRRGTPAGVQQAVQDYAGIAVRLVEHFRLRPLLTLPDDPARASATGSARLWSRDFFRRLQVGVYSQIGSFRLLGDPEPGAEPVTWGAHQFSVFFDAEPLSAESTRQKVATVVEREKPAHTVVSYRPVFARLRLGVQSTLGVDTRVGGIGEMVLNRMATLNYDSILARSPAERAVQHFGAVSRSQIGVNARLN